jgi:quercetin dioxygenase-like cupin family protein
MDQLSARGEEIPDELHERYDVHETETGEPGVGPVVVHGAGRIAHEHVGLILADVPAGMVIRPHLHREHADAFSVIGGELAARIGAERFVAGAGAALVAAPGVVHAFVAGASGARVLNVHAPDCGFVDSAADTFFVEEEESRSS